MTALDGFLLHQGRLAICAALLDVEEASFRTLAAATEMSDSLLSRNMAALSEAGYIAITKDYRRTGGRTWAALTERGRDAVAALVADLTRLTTSKKD